VDIGSIESMPSSRKYLWLSAILAAEAILFLWKCNHFFNGDSLYFFSHQMGNWADIRRVFSRPDDLWQYRPLTFIIFSFLLRPLFGLNPIGYNLFPLLVHAANTLLVFGIFRKLGLTQRAALLGTFFFGIHSTAFYVTYGVAFLPDFSYSFFYLASVFFFMKYLRAERYLLIALSLLFFLVALLCKEAAITLPVVILMSASLFRRHPSELPGSSAGRIRSAVSRSFHFVFLGGMYLAFHFLSKSGQLYAPGIDHPHHSEFSFYALHLKYKYLKWAFNLPDGLVFSFQGLTNYLIAFAILIFVIPFVFSTIRRLSALDPLVWFGCIWFVAALSPVLFLRNLTMNHNLYIPIVGLALLMGEWLARVIDYFPSDSLLWPRTAVSSFVFVFMVAVLFHNWRAAKDSWIAQASTIAETSLQDLKRMRPVLPDGATLCFVDRSSLGTLRWYYDYGSLVRLFYPSRSLAARFVDSGHPLPGRSELPEGALIFEYDGTHLSEVSPGPDGWHSIGSLGTCEQRELIE
jgi:hypothetical protein